MLGSLHLSLRPCPTPINPTQRPWLGFSILIFRRNRSKTRCDLKERRQSAVHIISPKYLFLAPCLAARSAVLYWEVRVTQLETRETLVYFRTTSSTFVNDGTLIRAFPGTNPALFSHRPETNP